MKDFSKHVIQSSQAIRDALIRLDKLSEENKLTLFVLNEHEQLVGTITDGDLRRGFLRGLTIDDAVTQVMRRDYAFLRPDFCWADVLVIKGKAIKLAPVLDQQRRILDVYDMTEKVSILPIEVVIMAGGQGLRLGSLTESIPKPLLTLGNKRIIEYSLDGLVKYGVTRFFITVRYLAEHIIEYLGDGQSRGVKIQYIQEDNPLGTLGAVSMITDFSREHILITNSDIFTNIDYERFYQDFIEAEADMAIATIPYTIDVPYAVLQLQREKVVALKEKPSFTYYSNAGMYLVKRSMLDLIPKGQYYDTTQLIQSLLDQGCHVVYSPITGYWIDIGKLEDYQKAKELVKHTQ